MYHRKMNYTKTQTLLYIAVRERLCLERREVEKRIYGVERERLTASATFLLLRYRSVLNRQ